MKPLISQPNPAQPGGSENARDHHPRLRAAFDDLRTRFIRVVGRSVGHLPEWRHAAGGKVLMFADEIVVEQEGRRL